MIVANGVALHTQRLGAAGSPVVMLHGLLVGSLATWYFTAAPALARRHSVLLYDLRGHGRSERATTGYDVATLAADLGALCDGFSTEPLTLVGHSYGALVALRYALDRPGRVARLVLVEAPLPPSRIEELGAFLALPPDGMVAALPAPLRALLERGGRRPRRLLEGLAFLAGETTLGRDLAAELDIPDDALGALRLECRLIYGSMSSCRPVGDRLLRVIPGATLRVLEGGHYLPVEAPAALTEALL